MTHLSINEQLLNSFFLSVNSRTAGYLHLSIIMIYYLSQNLLIMY